MSSTKEEKIALIKKRVKAKEYEGIGGYGLVIFSIQYQELVDILGEPEDTYDDKTDAEWKFTFDGVSLYVYNWKNGVNYCGKLGGRPVEFITDWYIGGRDQEKATEFIEFIKNNRPGPYPEKEINEAEYEDINEIIRELDVVSFRKLQNIIDII